MPHLFVQPSWNTDLIPSNSPQSTAVTAVCVHARVRASACLPACLSVCLSVCFGGHGLWKRKKIHVGESKCCRLPSHVTLL